MTITIPQSIDFFNIFFCFRIFYAFLQILFFLFLNNPQIISLSVFCFRPLSPRLELSYALFILYPFIILANVLYTVLGSSLAPRDSTAWKREYDGRTSVERSNKREKEDYKLEDGRHRSTKMWYCRLYGIMMLQHLDAWEMPSVEAFQKTLLGFPA